MNGADYLTRGYFYDRQWLWPRKCKIYLQSSSDDEEEKKITPKPSHRKKIRLEEDMLNSKKQEKKQKKVEKKMQNEKKNYQERIEYDHDSQIFQASKA